MEAEHSNPPTILICDDHSVVRSGLRKEIERLTNFRIIGEATNGKEAYDMALEFCPDVMLLDINMQKFNGIQVTEKLNDQHLSAKMTAQKQEWPPRILVLSAHCDPEYVYSLFSLGAKGYLLKDEPPEAIINAIHLLLNGDPAISLPIQKILLHSRQPASHLLSRRELDVLKLMAKGFTNDEIGAQLVISVGTVKNHVTNIYQKVPEVRSRSEAVAWAWMNKIVSL